VRSPASSLDVDGLDIRMVAGGRVDDDHLDWDRPGIGQAVSSVRAIDHHVAGAHRDLRSINRHDAASLEKDLDLLIPGSVAMGADRHAHRHQGEVDEIDHRSGGTLNDPLKEHFAAPGVGLDWRKLGFGEPQSCALHGPALPIPTPVADAGPAPASRPWRPR
jgi:hypothetical protein